MKSQKHNFNFICIMLLLCISAFLGGYLTNRSKEPSEVPVEAETGINTSSDITADTSTDATADTNADTSAGTSAEIEEGDITSEPENLSEVTDAPTNPEKETVAQVVNKDIDSNGIMDAVQIIHRNYDSESFIRVYLNEEQIFEYEDPDIKLMAVDALEALDLDGDALNEIFITAETNANSRPLMDVLCLKQTEGQWNRMDIPLNETGNNGFSFKITRGKDEFDFIISSDDVEQEIHFDAAHFFVDDELGNIDSIQAYRSNHYKEGDEVGFISAWGIWEARTGTYEGRNCILALQGIEGPYGHSLGQINIYFAYNKQGNVEVLKVEYQS